MNCKQWKLVEEKNTLYSMLQVIFIYLKIIDKESVPATASFYV